MSGNAVIFAICFPIDLVYVGLGAWWVYRDAQLAKPDVSMRKLRRWVLFVLILAALWQLFTFTPWQKGKPATHIPAEIALSGMLLFGYWVGYLWVGDWCAYYFAKFHKPFPNAAYYIFGVSSVIAGISAALRSIVPFLADDMWLYDLFMLMYIVPLIFGLAACVKLAWDIRQMSKQRYTQILSDAEEDEEPLLRSRRRVHMCKVNLLILYFASGFLSIVYFVPQIIKSLQEIQPGTTVHSRPEAPVGLVIGTSLSFWIPYAVIMWYTKFEWKADPLDSVKSELPTTGEGAIGLDTMTKV